MARYKRLKGLAHDLGHSFPSLMNYVRDDHVADHLCRAARKAGATRVEIEALSGSVSPPEFGVPAVQESRSGLRSYFPRWCETVGAERDVIRSATIAIDFHFNRPYISRGVGRRDTWVEYDCRVRIEDDRGRIHEAQVPEWFRYSRRGVAVQHGVAVDVAQRRFNRGLVEFAWKLDASATVGDSCAPDPLCARRS